MADTQHSQDIPVYHNEFGRQEILRACWLTGARCRKAYSANQINENTIFERHLYTAGIYDPDLYHYQWGKCVVMLSSGSKLCGNFYNKTLWPICAVSFTKLYSYQQRERRFGRSMKRVRVWGQGGQGLRKKAIHEVHVSKAFLF